MLNLSGVFPLALTFNILVMPRLAGVPLPLRALGLGLYVTVLMTWVIRPWLTRVLHCWLYAEPPGARRSRGPAVGRGQQVMSRTPLD